MTACGFGGPRKDPGGTIRQQRIMALAVIKRFLI